MADSATLLQATSAGIERDGSTYVVLRWEAVDGVDGYNLYRRLAERPAAQVPADQREHADRAAVHGAAVAGGRPGGVARVGGARPGLHRGRGTGALEPGESRGRASSAA